MALRYNKYITIRNSIVLVAATLQYFVILREVCYLIDDYFLNTFFRATQEHSQIVKLTDVAVFKWIKKYYWIDARHLRN